MLAQWKSDGFITCKCLDRNEDMYKFFLYIAILSSRRIKRVFKLSGRAMGASIEMRTCMTFLVTAILSSSRIKLFLGSSVLYQSMLAQWKSDGFITRKCLDRNEDMYEFFGHSYIVLQ